MFPHHSDSFFSDETERQPQPHLQQPENKSALLFLHLPSLCVLMLFIEKLMDSVQQGMSDLITIKFQF